MPKTCILFCLMITICNIIISGMEHCRHFSNLVPNFQIRIFKFLLKSPSLQTLFSSHTQILSSKTFPFNLFIQSLLFIPVYPYPFTSSKSKTILRYNLIHGPLFVGYSILIVPIILVPGLLIWP